MGEFECDSPWKSVRFALGWIRVWFGFSFWIFGGKYQVFGWIGSTRVLVGFNGG